jgi:hypothetical protein
MLFYSLYPCVPRVQMQGSIMAGGAGDRGQDGVTAPTHTEGEHHTLRAAGRIVIL